MRNDKYRLNISVTKGDMRATVIKQIAGNMQIGTNDIPEALRRISNFFMHISMIESGDFNSYGVATIIDQEAGEIVGSFHVGNSKEQALEIVNSIHSEVKGNKNHLGIYDFNLI